MTCNVTISFNEEVDDSFVGYFTYVVWFIVFPIVILNLLLLFVIVCNKDLRKRRSNKFALSLFTFHALNGISGFIEAGNVIATRKSSMMFREGTWRYYLYLSGQVISGSIFINMLLIVIDRFMAIRYPFFYQNVKTRTLILYAFLIGNFPYSLGWIVSSIKHKQVAFLTIAVTIPPVLSFVVYANSVVYMQTRKQFKDIVKLTISNDHTENTKERQRLAKRQLRSLRVCLSLMLSFLIAWLPLVVLMLFAYFVGSSCININLFLYVHALWSLNSVVDPILYASFNRDVKNKLKRIITICKTRKNDTERENQRC
ncbi:cannabinoid receptor 1-like [Hydractinia symbiolongicarpus]|uniref:cannabinoid receptor 1-like n=1 Tax=Hydractinia symbiolongicarpus TaxID=13093 RepID=UPI00254DAA47|nr:cannabinoid receptor 1-like [Hydractinia symbiolongicarpus]